MPKKEGHIFQALMLSLLTLQNTYIEEMEKALKMVRAMCKDLEVTIANYEKETASLK